MHTHLHFHHFNGEVGSVNVDDSVRLISLRKINARILSDADGQSRVLEIEPRSLHILRSFALDDLLLPLSHLKRSGDGFPVFLVNGGQYFPLGNPFDVLTLTPCDCDCVILKRMKVKMRRIKFLYCVRDECGSNFRDESSRDCC